MSLNINTSKKCDQAAQLASEKLFNALDHSVKTLLMLSGGSSLEVAKRALSRLSKRQKSYITLAQIDERYGKADHKDSNWKGVKKIAGDLNDYAGTLQIIQGTDSIEEDSAYYNAGLRQALSDNVLKIGLLGIGADGHTAGMLPSNEFDFLKYLDGRLVVNYQGEDFPRVTTTSALLRVLDEAIVYACGPSKEKAICELDKDLPVHKHPAQLLKKTNQVWIYYGKATK